MRDVFRTGIKQKYWKDYVNTCDLGCHLVVVQRNARTACRCWWVYGLFISHWAGSGADFSSWATWWFSCTVCLVVKYMTVAVNLLTAHSSSQGLGWVQQATNRKSHAAWVPECIKGRSYCCLNLLDVSDRRTLTYCWQATYCFYLAIFC